jgi:serine/threonine protein kinase
MVQTLPSTPHLSPGQVLAGRYRIGRVFGEGAMGVVYAAEHELLKQKVALKLMRPALGVGPRARVRFLNEARHASQIQSDHVVRVLDVGLLDSGAPFMVMELLDGADLAALAQERVAPLPIAETVDWLVEAVDAIAHAHTMGIVHRDLKPSNLFLSNRPDGTRRIKVLDFGISKEIHFPAASAITATDAVLGTPLYMSPEQLRGAKEVDTRTDIWALGVVAYQLLTGHLPFCGENLVALFAATTETIPLPLRQLRPEIAEGLETAVLRCLRRDPAERFARAADFGADLAPHGTSAAAQTLARVLCVAYPIRSTSLRGKASESPPTLAETDERESVSSEGARAGQSVIPWSTGEGSSTPKPLDGSRGQPTRRFAAVRAALVTGVVAFGLLGGISIARRPNPRVPGDPIHPADAPVAQPIPASDRPTTIQPLSVPRIAATETSTADAGIAAAIHPATQDTAPPNLAVGRAKPPDGAKTRHLAAPMSRVAPASGSAPPPSSAAEDLGLRTDNPFR